MKSHVLMVRVHFGVSFIKADLTNEARLLLLRRLASFSYAGNDFLTHWQRESFIAVKKDSQTWGRGVKGPDNRSLAAFRRSSEVPYELDLCHGSGDSTGAAGERYVISRENAFLPKDFRFEKRTKQKSCFEGFLTLRQCEQMEREASLLIDGSCDSLRVYRVCDSAMVHSWGRGEVKVDDVVIYYPRRWGLRGFAAHFSLVSSCGSLPANQKLGKRDG